MISDKGPQFWCDVFKDWCDRRGITPRFGAVGQHGSIALVERFILTLKNECTELILVPFRCEHLHLELMLFTQWYNQHRPHSALNGKTPHEVYRGIPPACEAPRFEPRVRWPPTAPCASPQSPISGDCGTLIQLELHYLSGRKHLPIITLKRAA